MAVYCCDGQSSSARGAMVESSTPHDDHASRGDRELWRRTRGGPKRAKDVRENTQHVPVGQGYRLL